MIWFFYTYTTSFPMYIYMLYIIHTSAALGNVAGWAAEVEAGFCWRQDSKFCQQYQEGMKKDQPLGWGLTWLKAGISTVMLGWDLANWCLLWWIDENPAERWSSCSKMNPNHVLIGLVTCEMKTVCIWCMVLPKPCLRNMGSHIVQLRSVVPRGSNTAYWGTGYMPSKMPWTSSQRSPALLPRSTVELSRMA